MIYLDSSALVKRYVAEDGSDAIDRLLADHPYAATSRLAYPEILSALNRKHRAREFSARILGELIAAFESDWGKLFILEFDEDLLPIVKQAIRKHAIRGADAVHLASGMWLRSVLKEDVVFACADSKLLDAARAERLLAFDPAQSVAPLPPSPRRATRRGSPTASSRGGAAGSSPPDGPLPGYRLISPVSIRSSEFAT